MTAQCNIAGVDRYRLDPLRETRRRDERASRGALADAIAHARVTADEVAAAHRRVDDARAALAGARRACEEDARASADAHARAERYVARRRRDLDAAIGELVRAEARHAGRAAGVDETRRRLAHARAAREVIERHFAAWREARRKLADRREE